MVISKAALTEAIITVINEGLRIFDNNLNQYVLNLREQRGDKNVRRDSRSRYRDFTD